MVVFYIKLYIRIWWLHTVVTTCNLIFIPLSTDNLSISIYTYKFYYVVSTIYKKTCKKYFIYMQVFDMSIILHGFCITFNHIWESKRYTYLCTIDILYIDMHIIHMWVYIYIYDGNDEGNGRYYIYSLFIQI